jgi:hypothetical protein
LKKYGWLFSRSDYLTQAITRAKKGIYSSVNFEKKEAGT